jgi:hypothetical protein
VQMNTNMYIAYYLNWIDWLIISWFPFHSIIFQLYGDVTITGVRLQNLGLCSAFRAFKQGRTFIVSHLLWHGSTVFYTSHVDESKRHDIFLSFC